MSLAVKREFVFKNYKPIYRAILIFTIFLNFLTIYYYNFLNISHILKVVHIYYSNTTDIVLFLVVVKTPNYNDK